MQVLTSIASQAHRKNALDIIANAHCQQTSKSSLHIADFALIIRAISVLEGIALVGDPKFAIVDEAYPFIAKLLLTDQSPRLQAALRYMVR